MKKIFWILVMLAVATPTWAAKKITVQDLKDFLATMHQLKRTDEEVSEQLEEMDISEQLTSTVASDLLFASPGPLTSEQIDVMKVRSALLAPPASDLPNLPAPEAAAQKSILEKAIDVATQNDHQIHNLIASKAVSRYGNVNKFNNWTVGTDRVYRPDDHALMKLKARFSETVKIEEGAESVTSSLDDPRLRKINQTPEGGVRPSPSQMLSRAQENESIHWLRWETINGVKNAVFTFSINKKPAFYSVDYCCFLKSDGAGYISAPFKKAEGIHGEFFIDPETGKMKRIIILVDFSPTDFVEREDTRIDFDAETIDGVGYFVPERSTRISEVSSMGDSAKGYLKVRTVMVSGYSDYHLAGDAQK